MNTWISITTTIAGTGIAALAGTWIGGIQSQKNQKKLFDEEQKQLTERIYFESIFKNIDKWLDDFNNDNTDQFKETNSGKHKKSALIISEQLRYFNNGLYKNFLDDLLRSGNSGSNIDHACKLGRAENYELLTSLMTSLCAIRNVLFSILLKNPNYSFKFTKKDISCHVTKTEYELTAFGKKYSYPPVKPYS